MRQARPVQKQDSLKEYKLPKEFKTAGSFIEHLVAEFEDADSVTTPKQFKIDVILPDKRPPEERTKRVVFDLTLGIVAAWIGAKIAEGLLQRLGAYIFDSIFPYFKEEEQKELIQKLAATFRQILQEEAVRRAGASLTSLMNKMRDYSNQVGNQVDRLTDSTSHAQDLVSELQSLGLQGFLAFLAAAGLQLAVIQARYWNPITRDEGEKTNALQHIADSTAHLDRMNTEATIVLANRFGPVSFSYSPGGVLLYFYSLDGQIIGFFGTFEAAKAASDQKYEEELERILTEVIHPATLIKEKWRQLSEQVPNWDQLVNQRIGTIDPTI